MSRVRYPEIGDGTDDDGFLETFLAVCDCRSERAHAGLRVLGRNDARRAAEHVFELLFVRWDERDERIERRQWVERIERRQRVERVERRQRVERIERLERLERRVPRGARAEQRGGPGERAANRPVHVLDVSERRGSVRGRDVPCDVRRDQLHERRRLPHIHAAAGDDQDAGQVRRQGDAPDRRGRDVGHARRRRKPVRAVRPGQALLGRGAVPRVQGHSELGGLSRRTMT